MNGEVRQQHLASESNLIHKASSIRYYLSCLYGIPHTRTTFKVQLELMFLICGCIGSY